jgi:hypothetical protein
MTSIRVATTLLVLALGGGGCALLPGDAMVPAESRADADELEKDLAGMAGVADAEVEISHDFDGYDPAHASVTLSDGTSEAGVAAVIAAVPDLVAASGLTQLETAEIVLDAAASAVLRFADEDGVATPSRPLDPAASARLLVRLVDVAGDRAKITVESPLDARLTFAGGAESDLSPFLHDVLADPVLSDEDISWVAMVFADTDDPLKQLTREVAAGPGGLAATVRGYDGIVASYDAAPPEVASFTVVASDLGRRGVKLSTEMFFEPDVTDTDLTPATWGDRLGPVLSAQADTVDTLGHGSYVEVIRHESSHSMVPFFTYPYAGPDPALEDWVRLVARM